MPTFKFHISLCSRLCLWVKHDQSDGTLYSVWTESSDRAAMLQVLLHSHQMPHWMNGEWNKMTRVCRERERWGLSHRSDTQKWLTFQFWQSQWRSKRRMPLEANPILLSRKKRTMSGAWRPILNIHGHLPGKEVVGYFASTCSLLSICIFMQALCSSALALVHCLLTLR